MLRCVSPYKADAMAYKAGDVIDNPALEAHLLHDSPGSFEAVKSIEGAPVDKMLRPAAKKGGKR